MGCADLGVLAHLPVGNAHERFQVLAVFREHCETHADRDADGGARTNLQMQIVETFLQSGFQAFSMGPIDPRHYREELVDSVANEQIRFSKLLFQKCCCRTYRFFAKNVTPATSQSSLI